VTANNCSNELAVEAAIDKKWFGGGHIRRTNYLRITVPECSLLDRSIECRFPPHSGNANRLIADIYAALNLLFTSEASGPGHWQLNRHLPLRIRVGRSVKAHLTQHFNPVLRAL
jgi:hypothetical protein